MQFENYQNAWQHAHLMRSEDGVLEIKLHTDNGPLWWGGSPHRELPELFAAVAADRANRVVILTGTGSHFIDYHAEDAAKLAGGLPVGLWDSILWEGKRLITNYLDIDVPVISAINGPVRAHSELAVMADIVLAADTTVFQDAPHFKNGVVPGDSMQIIWPHLIGLNRARYFLLTGQEIVADEALRLGVVAEVLAHDALLDRARALAAELAQCDRHVLRFTRHVCTHRLKKMMLEELELGLALEGLAAAGGGGAR